MIRWHSRQELQGTQHTIHYLTDGDTCPVQEFLDALKKSELGTHKKITNRLRMLAYGPLPQNDEFCKELEEDLWELKARPARVFFFGRGRGLHFCRGYKKKTDRLDPEEVRRAREMRDGWAAET